MGNNEFRFWIFFRQMNNAVHGNSNFVVVLFVYYIVLRDFLGFSIWFRRDRISWRWIIRKWGMQILHNACESQLTFDLWSHPSSCTAARIAFPSFLVNLRYQIFWVKYFYWIWTFGFHMLKRVWWSCFFIIYNVVTYIWYYIRYFSL